MFLRLLLFSSFLFVCFVVVVVVVVVVVFLFYGTLPPVIVSLSYALLAHSVPVQMREEKKLCLVQDGNLRALVTGRSLFWLPLSGTTFLLITSDTAVLSHSSQLLLKPFSLLLPTLSYSN